MDATCLRRCLVLGNSAMLFAAAWFVPTPTLVLCLMSLMTVCVLDATQVFDDQNKFPSETSK